MSDMISKKDAESLAVFYQAFHERDADDHRGMIVWGGGLLELQDKTGIELVYTNDLRTMIERARRKLYPELAA